MEKKNIPLDARLRIKGKSDSVSAILNECRGVIGQEESVIIMAMVI